MLRVLLHYLCGHGGIAWSKRLTQEVGTRLCPRGQAESHAHNYVHTQRDTTLTTTQHYVYTHTYMYTILYIHVVVHYTIHSSRQQDVQCTKRQIVHSGTLCSSRQSTCAGVRSLAARQRGTVEKSLRTHATKSLTRSSRNGIIEVQRKRGRHNE